MFKTSHHDPSAYMLCIYCRAIEHVNQPCPSSQGRLQTAPANVVNSASPTSGPCPQDDRLIGELQEQPSSLCARCSSYNILNIFKVAQPRDKTQRRPGIGSDTDRLRMRLHLGRPSSLVLTPSCQFCRILYCILPRCFDPGRYDGGGAKSARVVGTGEPDLYIEPYRSYLRSYGWDIYPEDLRNRSAIVLGLAISSTNSLLVLDGDSMREPHMSGPAICLESRFAAADRTLFACRPLENSPDLSLLRKVLDFCLQEHSDLCRIEKPPELLATQMIDVINRTVIPCPPGCDYVALSYVWGGIQPSHQALKNGCLPRTIEDAIVVTKALGRRYLWVDALCIDQSPNPTPSQAKAKLRQLDMMSTIYGCATVTIVALTGKDANAGLSGISVPRLTQVKENVGGYTVFTSPQMSELEIKASTWRGRAWTMQEEILSRRKFFFTESQIMFSCVAGEIIEEIDVATQPDYYVHRPLNPLQSRFYATHSAQQLSDDGGSEKDLLYFSILLRDYTNRRMTNETDSLNAFRGVLTVLKRNPFHKGFIHGLPLKSHPYSLAWMHSRDTIPKRRSMFPSWSWTGWEAQVVYPEKFWDAADGSLSTTLDVDLQLRFLASHEDKIDVEGWLVDLDVRTEPLSEIFIGGGQDKSIGTVKEGDSRHNNTLETKIYTCLVIRRHRQTVRGCEWRRETIFMLALEMGTNHQQARRQAMLTVTMFSGHSFDRIRGTKQVVQLI